jgi:hypothetical protein
MSPVANDFAAIAQRLKEIQAEVANAHAASESPRQSDAETQSGHRNVDEDFAACA